MELQGEGIGEPAPQVLLAELRRAVLDHVRSERRRSFPALLHVGRPAGPQHLHATAPDEPLDAALRTDLVAALLRAAVCGPQPPLLWLSRPGELTLQDVDAGWLAASRAACAEAEQPLVFVVVTRRGWWDPRSGTQRTWQRLRAR